MALESHEARSILRAETPIIEFRDADLGLEVKIIF
jgi:hypothetical protein